MNDESSRPADLLARITAGDRQAEEELVARFSRGVMFLLRHRTHDPELASDLHQDTFQLVLVKARAGEIREADKLKAFISAIANNLLIEYYRKTKRRGTRSDTEMIQRVAEENRGPFEALELEQLQAHVRQVLEEMSVERDRRLLRRYFIDEIPKDSLCRELDLSPEHFDRVKHRAIKRLIELVKSAGGRLH